MTRSTQVIAALFGVAGFVATGMAQTGQTNEAVARRQLESGRAFARQGNYTEALNDFRAVAETHAGTSVADDALLEIARYQFDVAADYGEAAAAVEAILANYATSDSAPDAYVLAGRLALVGNGTAAPDLDTALANFDRVSRLFPRSAAVPRSLQLAGETLWQAGRLDDALGRLTRVIAEFPNDEATADAYLAAGQVLLALGDPTLAMEELQQIRNRWPGDPAAAAALDRITLIHRLYVRAVQGAAFRADPQPVGPARLDNVFSLAATPAGAVYAATNDGVRLVAPADADPPPAISRPRAIGRDARGGLAVFDGVAVRLNTGDPITFFLPQDNGSVEALDKIVAFAQLSGGDWLVMDDDQRAIHRFSATGSYVGPFAMTRITRLVVSARDEVAGLDRDGRDVQVFGPAGQSRSRILLRSEGYDLRDAEDIAWDALGHLYVLDRESIGVFSPYRAAGGAAPPDGTSFRLLTQFTARGGAPDGFDRARAFALDSSGAIFLFDDRTKNVRVYR